MVISNGRNVCIRCGKLYMNGQVTVEYDLTENADIFCDTCYVSFLKNYVLLGRNSEDDNVIGESILAYKKLERLKYYLTTSYECMYVEKMKEVFGDLWDNVNEDNFKKQKNKR